MSKDLIANEDFQTVVPSQNGIYTVRSLDNNDPENQGIVSDFQNVDVPIQPGGSCFDVNSLPKIKTLQELLTNLCEVMIRFDNNPKNLTKSDYEQLIKTLTNSLIYLYTSGVAGGDMLKAVYDMDDDGIVDKSNSDALGNIIHDTYTKLSELKSKLGISESGDPKKFLNEQGDFTTVDGSKWQDGLNDIIEPKNNKFIEKTIIKDFPENLSDFNNDLGFVSSKWENEIVISNVSDWYIPSRGELETLISVRNINNIGSHPVFNGGIIVWGSSSPVGNYHPSLATIAGVAYLGGNGVWGTTNLPRTNVLYTLPIRNYTVTEQTYSKELGDIGMAGVVFHRTTLNGVSTYYEFSQELLGPSIWSNYVGFLSLSEDFGYGAVNTNTMYTMVPGEQNVFKLVKEFVNSDVSTIKPIDNKKVKLKHLYEINSSGNIDLVLTEQGNFRDISPLYNHTTDTDLHVATNERVDWNTAFSIIGLEKSATGWDKPSLPIVTYDAVNRTVTVVPNGATFYYRGNPIDMGVSHTSVPHGTAFSSYFYYYNELGFVWSTTTWTFDVGMISAIQYTNTYKIALRETHGLMPYLCHEADHFTIGTYLLSGADSSNYTLNSTTPANRRPTFSTAIVKDEDLPSVVNPVSTGQYCHRYLTGSQLKEYTTDQTEIVVTNGSLPRYNINNAGTWSFADFPGNGHYGAIFVVAVPVTNDTNSQKYRYLFVQPQQTSTSLSVIQALTSNNLVHGEAIGLLPEFVFVGKIIIQRTSNNWSIVSVEKLTGSRLSQVAFTGISLSSVAHDDTLTGSGVASDPLKVAVPLTTIEKSQIWNTPEWVTGTSYKIGNTFTVGAIQYKAIADHISSTIQADLSAGKIISIGGGDDKKLSLVLFKSGINGEFYPRTFKWTSDKIISQVLLMSNCSDIIVTIDGTQYNSTSLIGVTLPQDIEMTIDDLVIIAGSDFAEAIIIF